MNRYSGRHFALFRIALGLFVAGHLISLIPYVTEAYSSAGIYGRAAAGPFPNLLHLMHTPVQVAIVLACGAAWAVAFALGVGRRIGAVLLWYLLTCLINYQDYVVIPSDGYLGWLLLASALVPAGEPWSLSKTRDDWAMPRIVFVGAWIVVAVSYSTSGLDKAFSPSWASGVALRTILESPIARDWPTTELALRAPSWLMRGGNNLSGLAELYCAPLCLYRHTRLAVFVLLTTMHLLNLVLLSITTVSLGMLIVHLFLFEPRWYQLWRWRRRRVEESAAGQPKSETKSAIATSAQQA